MIPSDSDDRDVLAGEYVLGLIEPDALPEVERRLATDPDFADRVAFWESKLLPLADTLAPVRPDLALWARIERDLSAPPDSRAAARLGAGARPHPSLTRRLWRSAPLWRGATALAAAAAVLLTIFPVRPLEAPAEPATRFFALLQSRDAGGGDGGPGWLIQVAEDGTVRSLPLGRVDPGTGRALQLWTLWDAARGPVSLGVLPPGGSVRLPPERLPVIGGGQLFEITLEPAAGSPTGRPTGRILFIGRVSTAPAPTL